VTRPAQRPKVAVAGYLSLDTIRCPAGSFTDVVGGGALYAALGAAAAGGDVHLVALAGHDFPESALEGLAALGIRLEAVERAAISSRRSDLVEPDAAPERVSHRTTPAYDQAEWWQHTRMLAPPPLDAPLDAYMVTAMPAMIALAHIRVARWNGALVVADTSEAFARAEPEGVLRVAAAVDVFAPSREEVRWLVNADDLSAHAKLAAHTPVVVQKRGADGYWLSAHGGPPSSHPSRATRVADATGAGDAGVGALTVGLAQGLAPAAALELAAAITARAVSAVGPAGLGLALPGAVES
jgi:ribokinase